MASEDVKWNVSGTIFKQTISKSLLSFTRISLRHYEQALQNLTFKARMLYASSFARYLSRLSYFATVDILLLNEYIVGEPL